MAEELENQENLEEKENHEEQHQENPEEKAGKSYTQDQLNSMMANEKRTARQALLKELGFEYKDDKTFKETMKNIKQTLDAGKSQAELDKEARKTAESERDTATTRAAYLELKVSALSEGAKPETLDDLIALAKTKVTEENTIDKVLKDMKKQYPVFFKGDDEDDNVPGTGGSTNPRRRSGKDTAGQYGQSLAHVGKPTTKSSYFDN